MWSSRGNNLQMVEGDYGISIPITVNGADLGVNDELRVTIKQDNNGTTLIEKTYSDIDENTINFELTESESAKLAAGSYVYSLDWFQSGSFLCNIIPTASFKVVDKA